MRRLLAAAAPAVLVSTLAAGARAQGLEPPPPFTPGAPGTPASGPQGQPGQPPGMPPSGQQAQGQQQSSDDSQDSGLGLEWVYLNADAGVGYVNMTSFSASTLGLVSQSGAGPAFGVGAGVRLLFFTVGARARDELISGLGSLWLLNLEAAFHMRIWHIDPYFGVRGGYNFVGSLNSSTVNVATGNTPGDVSIHGWNVGPMFGIDLYFNSLISVGADAEAQFLFIQRPKVPLPAGCSEGASGTVSCGGMAVPPPGSDLYNNSGSSVGFGGVVTAHLGIHF